MNKFSMAVFAITSGIFFFFSWAEATYEFADLYIFAIFFCLGLACLLEALAIRRYD